MPSYAYICDACGEAHEDFHAMSEPHPAFCPHCQEPFGELFRQQFAGIVPNVWAYGNPTTFGQQAEINARRVGKEQMQQMEEKYNPKPKKEDIPWYRNGSCGTPVLEKPINLNKITDINRYIETGKQ